MREVAIRLLDHHLSILTSDLSFRPDLAWASSMSFL